MRDDNRRTQEGSAFPGSTTGTNVDQGNKQTDASRNNVYLTLNKETNNYYYGRPHSAPPESRPPRRVQEVEGGSLGTKRKADDQDNEEVEHRKRIPSQLEGFKRKKWYHRVKNVGTTEPLPRISYSSRNSESNKYRDKPGASGLLNCWYSLGLGAKQDAVFVYNRQDFNPPSFRDFNPRDIVRDTDLDGITFLSSPAREPIRLSPSSSSHPWRQYLSRLSAFFQSGLSSDIRYDVVILAPPGKHPYEYWMGRFDGQLMWLVDFLANEGFDATRISVFAARNWKCQDKDWREPTEARDELLEALRELDIDGRPRIRHSILLVEFLLSETKFSLSDQILSSLPPSLEGKLHVLHVKHHGCCLMSVDSVRQLEPIFVPSGTLGITRNDNGTYRDLVTTIWRWIHPLSLDHQRNASLPRPDSRLKLDLPGLVEAFETMCELVDAVNLSDGHSNDAQNDSEFWGILHNSHYENWMTKGDAILRIVTSSEPDIIPSGPDAVSIPPHVKPSQWNLRSFCHSLSGHYANHQVLHIDLEAMATNCGLRGGQWTANNMIGPLILRIFKIAVENTSGTIDPLEFLCQRLNEKVNLVHFPEREGEISPFDRLILLTQNLGSGMVHVIGNALEDYYGMLGSDSKSVPSDWEADDCNFIDSLTGRPIMLALSGLHVLDLSPELGRLVYCISKLHEYINGHRDCGLLVTHRNSSDLDGLLNSFPCIKYNEYRDCLRSLQTVETGKHRVSRLPKDINERHPDTLNWFWNHRACQGWLRAGPKSLLLLSGKPACGKSVFSRFVLENLKPGGEDVVASFFFLNVHANGSAANDQRDMLQALLYGILEGAPELFPHFQSTYLSLRSDKEDGRPIEWTQSALEKVLAGVTSHRLPKTIWILIDGLDETTPEKSAACADCLGKLLPREGSAISLKLLVATQPRQPATNRLMEHFDKPGESWEITLQDENQDDIRAYINSFLNAKHLHRLDWREKNLEDCRNALLDSSRKVFLWVKLAERHIKEYISGHRQASISDFKRFLRGIPKDVEDLYEKLFARMVEKVCNQKNKEDRESQIKTVRAMLQVAIQAVNGSLLLDEFRDAYVVPGPEEWPGFRISDSRDANVRLIISGFSANLLELHFNGEDERVQFLHQTAVGFLQGKKIGGVPLHEDVCGQKLSTMGSACIYYLEEVTRRVGYGLGARLSLEIEEVQFIATQINEFPLLPYALENLEEHVKVELHQDRLAALVRHMRAGSVKFLLRNWLDSLAVKCGLSPSLGGTLGSTEFASNMLHVAVTQKLVTAVKVALLVGADVESQSTLYDSRERALCLLAMPPSELETDDQTMRAEVTICRLLLAHGAQPDAHSRFEGTALHYAGKNMRLGVVRELLRHHADVNSRDARSMTPLHRAVIGHRPKTSESTELDARRHTPRSASKDCVEALIKAGADIRAQEDQGETPIHWAAGQMNRVQILELLIRGKSIGNTEQSVRARKQAANLKCRNKRSTPLHWASGHGYLENVKLLIQYGADVSWANVAGKTALHWAAQWGFDDVLEELLKALYSTSEDPKAVVNSMEANDHTPLIWACRWGHLKCVKLLIEHGADVNLGQRNSDYGGTPISWAATCKHPDVIDLLVEKGAHMDETVLGWAAASGSIDTFEHVRSVARENNRELLVDGVRPYDKTPFMIAASHGRLRMAEYLRNMFQVNVHHRDVDGNTALHGAAKFNHRFMVEWLIEEAGLGIDDNNRFRSTALDRAIEYGSKEVVDYLRRKGGKRYDELGI